MKQNKHTIMKELIRLIVVSICIVVSVSSCKNEKKEDVKKEETKVTENKSPEEKPAKKKAPKTDPLKIIGKAPAGTTAKTVVDRYFEEIGGADKAKKVNTLLIKSSAKDTPTRTFNFVTKYKNPNKVYEQTSEKDEVFSKYAFNGEKGYSFYEGTTVEFSEEELEEYKNAEKHIFPDFDYAKGTLRGLAEVKGEKCYVIDYKHYKVYYSVETGLRVVVIEMAKDDGGKPVIALKMRTSNYTDVDGLKFPFKLHDVRPNLRTAKTDISEIIINKGVSDKDFEQ